MDSMKNQTRIYSWLAAALIFALGGLVAPGAAQAANVSKTAMAGSYTVTLKVLPAESFQGPKAAMARDAGAMPRYLNGPMRPNHHMVVFVKKDGKPVENATVKISYRRAAKMMHMWKKLPVVRMHVAGKGLATTHYGNNLKLAPGNYVARVTVNGKAVATFHFTLAG